MAAADEFAAADHSLLIAIVNGELGEGGDAPLRKECDLEEQKVAFLGHQDLSEKVGVATVVEKPANVPCVHPMHNYGLSLG